MTAAYRLKGFGWFGACTAIVLGFYLVSLQVASERKKLEHLDDDIAATQRDIRALETEFDTRANMAQLERWNGDTLALAAPSPAQFLRSEAELASAEVIRGPAAGAPTVRTAALVVPSFVAPARPAAGQGAAPVQAAVAASAPAAAAGHARPAPVQVARVDEPRATVRVAFATTVAAAHAPALRLASLDAGGTRTALRAAAVVRRGSQVALLDRKLLSDTTLRDLMGGARAEGDKLR